MNGRNNQYKCRIRLHRTHNVARWLGSCVESAITGHYVYVAFSLFIPVDDLFHSSVFIDAYPLNDFICIRQTVSCHRLRRVGTTTNETMMWL